MQHHTRQVGLVIYIKGRQQNASLASRTRIWWFPAFSVSLGSLEEVLKVWLHTDIMQSIVVMTDDIRVHRNVPHEHD